MKRTTIFLFCITALGLAGHSQSSGQKDKYGYNTSGSGFTKPVGTTASPNANRTATNSGYNSNRNTNTSTQSSGPSSGTSSPGLYERKDPPVNNPPATVQPLEAGRARKAKQ